ncbi:MAG: hypothetical protein ACFFDI_18770 [Promethearchaeota archaeon]
MSDPASPSFPPSTDEGPRYDLFHVIRHVHCTHQSADYEGVTITPQMASTFMSVYVQLSTADCLHLLSLPTQEIFSYVRRWTTANHPDTTHVVVRGDV